MEDVKLTPIARFNEHGAECKGHANSLTAETFETQEERNMLLKILDYYWPEAK